MTTSENKQRLKNEALNKIRKLYHPNTKHGFTYYPGEGSFGEQLSSEVNDIITNLEKSLKELKDGQ